MTSRHGKTTTTKLASKPTKRSRFRFFGDLVGELRKVHWPTRQETLRLSLLVIILCAIVGVILGVLDFGFTRLFTDLFAGA